MQQEQIHSEAGSQKEVEIVTNRKDGLQHQTEENNRQDSGRNQEEGQTLRNNNSRQSVDKKDEQLDVFGNDEVEVKSKYPRIEAILENNIFQTFITLLTIYALFGDDVRVMATNKHADIGFDIITIICLIMFSLEILLAVIAKENYINSFFFWLDVISTISLILDIQMVNKELFQAGGGDSASQLAQAGKASRVGTKAGRVVRLVRLIRIVKLYKAAQENEISNTAAIQKLQQKRDKRKKIHPKKQMNNIQTAQINKSDVSQVEENKSVQSPKLPVSPIQLPGQAEQNPPPNFKESRVSKRLSDLTTKRVIVIVLLLLFIMPLFSADYFFDSPTSIDYCVYNIQQMSEKADVSRTNLTNIFEAIKWIHTKDRLTQPLAYLFGPFTILETYQSKEYDDLRTDEMESASYQINRDKYIQEHPNVEEQDQFKVDPEGFYSFTGVLNKRSYAIANAGLSFGRTIFVCIVLTTGALMFSKDATDLALRPIEKMIENVNRIARNPNLAKELKLNKDESQMETVIIENAIIKIGSLLALGFGDAGSEIIGSNMAKGGDVDPMIPGKKKCAIYGFCDIRNFTDATEQLQEDVMLFVNNIGEVVHSMVDRYAGAANKNIGDAFLLVWKMPEEKYTIKEPDNTIIYHDNTFIQTLSDFSLISFMKIQAKLNREKKCLEYRTDERLLSRMKNYKVKMGYGLHVGWGIEGAIGSVFKIDASYLSPNVNMAARLEAGTKQFGVPFLISNDLQALFTPQMARFTRYIDRVTVKGSNNPTGLYTIDMDVDRLPPSKDPDCYNPVEKRETDRFKKLDIMSYLNDPINNPWDAEEYILGNKDLRLMMETFDEKFQAIFSEGFQHYLGGAWDKAKVKFTEVFAIFPEDGPTKNLMDVMGELAFKAPSDWPGYRVLTEK